MKKMGSKSRQLQEDKGDLEIAEKRLKEMKEGKAIIQTKKEFLEEMGA